MNDDYKEVPSRAQRPPPWKMKSLPKFTDVPGRKFNDRITNAKPNDEEPPTPPSSPIGMFKYPALLRGCKSWPRTTSVDAIVTDQLCDNTNHDGAFQEDNKHLKKVEPKTTHNFSIKIKPASGETKMYLWPQTKCIACPKFDLNSMPKTGSTKSLSKPSTSKVKEISRVSADSVLKKSINFRQAVDEKIEMSSRHTGMLNPLKNCFGTNSTEDFEVILKHAISHDPVTSKENSALAYSVV